MTDKPENPQAYPYSTYEKNPNGGMTVINDKGMTLRDYFAGQAMMGLYSNLDTALKSAIDDLDVDAELFYQIADAMLKERGKDNADT